MIETYALEFNKDVHNLSQIRFNSYPYNLFESYGCETGIIIVCSKGGDVIETNYHHQKARPIDIRIQFWQSK